MKNRKDALIMMPLIKATRKQPDTRMNLLLAFAATCKIARDQSEFFLPFAADDEAVRDGSAGAAADG